MAGLWPHEIGNLFVASCDASDKRVAFSCNEGGRIARERMTVFLPPRAFAQGEVVTNRCLVFLAPGEFRSVKAVQALQSRVLSPVSDLRLRSGTVVRIGSDLVCEAGDEHAVSGTFSMTHNPCGPLPLEVRGVRPGWPLALEEASGLRLLGACADTLRTVLTSADGSVTFTAGNLLLADTPDVRIEVDAVSKKRVRYLVHNPTSAALTCHVRANPAFLAVPAFLKRVTLAPGATVWQDSGEE